MICRKAPFCPVSPHVVKHITVGLRLVTGASTSWQSLGENLAIAQLKVVFRLFATQILPCALVVTRGSIPHPS